MNTRNTFLKQEFSGGCQCGAVRFHARKLRANPHLCHCRMCQKATGGLFAALVGVKSTDLTWTRGKPAAFVSSEHVERGFCRDCGTPLFYRYVPDDGYALTIGSFDEPHAIPLLAEMGLEARHPDLAPSPRAAKQTRTEDEDDAATLAGIAASNNQHPDHDTTDWTPRGRTP